MARRGNIIPLYTELIADQDTPVSVFKKLSRAGRCAYLLESLEGGEHWARYSFLSCDPTTTFRVDHGTVTVRTAGTPVRRYTTDNPMRDLLRFLRGYRPVHLEGLPRFWGGMVGYVSYDTVKYYERINSTTPDDLALPEAFFMLSDKLVVFDHLRHRLFVIVSVEAHRASLRGSYERGVRNLCSIVRSLSRPAPSAVVHRPAAPRRRRHPVRSTFTRGEFVQSVRAAKRYIHAGDCIQVVLSQRFSQTITAHPFDIYRALRIVNPSPYMYYLALEGFSIVGSSPEVLVRKEGRLIETRPIAGTRPRGQDEARDRKLEQELLADPKELAEHLMLVDLGRNDLGRVAEAGTVTVPQFKAIERYSHVMHIVSQVQARLRRPYGAADVFQSTFPAGTVSGAPKVRAMEIIEELEKTRRGPYAGAVGYVSFEGNMDMAITIRTILVKGTTAFVQAGAGIVADSVPAREEEETRNKAQALFRAIELADRGFV